MTGPGPHDWPPYYAPSRPGDGPPEPPSRPVDVRTAFELWCVVAVLSVVSVVAEMFVMFAQSDRFVDELIKQVHDQQPGVGFTREDGLFMFQVSMGIFALVLAVLIGVIVLAAFKLLQGRSWARTLLSAAGAMFVVFALRTAFGGGGGSGIAAAVLGITTILEGVCAVGAVVLVHRREATEYFVTGQR